MDFGINLATAADHWKVVKRAEELGFGFAWFYDTQMLNADPFVAMAAAAMVTNKIHLGTGVLIPSNRIAPVTANALASLNTLAPGRIHLGISTGFTARRAMGLGAVKLDDMMEHIRVVQGLLAGETLEWDYEGERRKIRFLNPELDLVNIADPIPLYISALGPKGKKLTAELGAGWINPMRNVEQGLMQLNGIQAAWADAGRSAEDLYPIAHASGCLLAEGEDYDSPRAQAQAGPSAVMVLHDMVEAGDRRTLGYKVAEHLQPHYEEYKALYEDYEPSDAKYLQVHKWHLMKLRPEEAHMATAEMIRDLSFTGPADKLIDDIRRLRDAGYKQFTIHIRYGQERMLEEWADLLERV